MAFVRVLLLAIVMLVRLLPFILIALLVQVARKKLPKLLPLQADPLPVYVAGGLSLASMAIALINSVAAYYAMWVLAIIAFGLAVYYTVKQL